MVEPPVGRTSEWTRYLELLAQGTSGLVLVHGPPGIGRSYLMQTMGEAARERGYLVIGTEEPLPIELTTRLGDIERAVGAHLDGRPAPVDRGSLTDVGGRFSRALMAAKDTWKMDAQLMATLRRASPAFIGVDGFAPSASVLAWILTRLLPRLSELTDPVVVVIVDRTERVAALESAAALSFPLGPLDRDEVTSRIRSRTDQLVPPLSGEELDAYAAAVAADPSLLSSLDRVLSALVSRSA